MITNPRPYFRDEKVRNRDAAVMFEELIHAAFGEHVIAIVGHHLTFEDTGGTPEENVKTENEIPSADTFMFDHEIMTALFGDDALMVMQSLASVRTDIRDKLLAHHWKMYGLKNREPAPAQTEVPTPAGNYSELQS